MSTFIPHGRTDVFKVFFLLILFSLIIILLNADRPVALTGTSSTVRPVSRETNGTQPTAQPTAAKQQKPDKEFERQDERDRMVTSQIMARGVNDEKVLAAMSQVPRHLFVPFLHRGAAYDDHPVPIGYGQTISQPYIVAFMTEVLQLNEHSRVLEIGTGSGYQAAVLAEITPHVFSVEIVSKLAQAVAQRFDELGYHCINTREGDGYFGWETEGPFDAIIVTAAAEHVPPPLVQQLKAGGRMCIPVGSPFYVQYLLLIEKDVNGTVTSRNLMAVRFVPFVREK